MSEGQPKDMKSAISQLGNGIVGVYRKVHVFMINHPKEKGSAVRKKEEAVTLLMSEHWAGQHVSLPRENCPICRMIKGR